MSRLSGAPGPIVTSALTTIEQEAFIENGFVEREALHLLRHDFANTPRTVSPATRLRTSRPWDLPRVLEIDRRSFDEFWRFDRAGLHSARRATPIHRYVVAVADHTVTGYAITGVAGRTSYLQRLAVHPDARGRGIGSHLVVDAIGWAIGRGSLAMMVNTQVANHGALRLYESLGFELDAEQLKVLQWPHA
jgi:ribosomal protein S18 acetylase RimI-like enzyme